MDNVRTDLKRTVGKSSQRGHRPWEGLGLAQKGDSCQGLGDGAHKLREGGKKARLVGEEERNINHKNRITQQWKTYMGPSEEEKRGDKRSGGIKPVCGLKTLQRDEKGHFKGRST